MTPEQLKRRLALLADGPAPSDWRRWHADPSAFISDLLWIDTPHDSRGLRLPLVLYPYQVEAVPWLLAGYARQEWRCIAKARDMGATWLALAMLLWYCRFIPGFKGAVLSYKQESVAKIGDPDALMSRVRFLVRSLPSWAGVTVPNEPEALAVFSNGSTIAGRWGDNPARGGRVQHAVWDEVAACLHQEQMAASLATAAGSALLLSTFSAPGNYFDRVTRSLPCLWWNWQLNPRHTQAWYEEQRARIDSPVLFAREIELNPEASMEGALLLPEWVTAAQEIRLQPGARVVGYDPAGDGDCAAAVCVRHGHVVSEVREVAGSLRNRARAVRALGGVMAYDACGGWGATTAEECPAGIAVMGNDGVPAWVPDSDRCANLRAALYWRLRWRLENTYRRLVCGEVQIAPEHCIQLPASPELRKQLLSIKLKERADGAILVESKLDMAKRGVESPDFADAVVYSEAALLLGGVGRAPAPARPALSSRRM